MSASLPPEVTSTQTRHLSRLIRHLGICLDEVFAYEEVISQYLAEHPGLRTVLAAHDTGDGCFSDVCTPCSAETVNEFIGYHLGEELPDTDCEAQAARILVRYLEIVSTVMARRQYHDQHIVEDLLNPTPEPGDGEATR